MSDTSRSWIDDSACLKKDPDLFHPTNNAYAEARAICIRCSVRLMCLVSSLQSEASDPRAGRHGMTGGLCPNERKALQDRIDREGLSVELLHSVIYPVIPL